MLDPNLGGSFAGQAMVLTGIGWTGLLLVACTPERVYRRIPLVAAGSALLVVVTVVSATLLLGMMPYSDMAIGGGVSIGLGALTIRNMRQRHAARSRDAVAVAWLQQQPAEQHVA